MMSLESRPLEVYPRHGADARALALQSSRERQKRQNAKVRLTAPAKLTPSAETYAKAEERYAAKLKRRAKSGGA